MHHSYTYALFFFYLYQARRDVLRQKSATKLQAVVRGHIVRSHAVGTLRCIQAIVRMQALVRARRPHLKVKNELTLLVTI